MGWNWSVQAALHGHEVTTITRANNRERIEAELERSPVPGLRFVYVDLPGSLGRLKKRLGFAGLYAYYYFWQIRVWFLARRLHTARPFDLVHHVTFVNDWMPSGVAGAPAPFIWGPVGGSTNVMPRAARDLLPEPFRRYEATRRVVQLWFRGVDPFVELTRRRARVILTYTDEALAGIPARHRSKAQSIVHIGISESDVPPGETGPSAQFRILSGGRLVHWKGFDLLLEGFARYTQRDGDPAQLVLTGEGSYRPELERLVETLGIGERVRFTGNLPNRADVFRELGSAHLYALPTWRDGPPVAILEAMLVGRPVLCLDRGATRELVPASCGLMIPVGSRNAIVEDIAKALEWASSHAAELGEMGRAAREHALAVHHWDRIGDEVDEIYRSVMG